MPICAMGAKTGCLLGTAPALPLCLACHHATHDLREVAAIPAIPPTVFAPSWACSYSGSFQAPGGEELAAEVSFPFGSQGSSEGKLPFPKTPHSFI